MKRPARLDWVTVLGLGLALWLLAPPLSAQLNRIVPRQIICGLANSVLQGNVGPSTCSTALSIATYQVNGVTMVSATAPTIASGGCTSPAVTSSNGTAAFLLTLGTSCTGVSTLTLTLPASAHFWACGAVNNTSAAQQAANSVLPRATSATAVILTNYAVATGIAADFTASDTVLVRCTAE